MCRLKPHETGEERSQPSATSLAKRASPSLSFTIRDVTPSPAATPPLDGNYISTAGAGFCQGDPNDVCTRGDPFYDTENSTEELSNNNQL